MKKFFLTLVALAGILSAASVNAQDFYFHRPRPYPYPYPYYYPYVQWYPSGLSMNIGPVFVSPDRRYVTFGINAGFSQYNGFQTFNYSTGETRYYQRNKK